MPIAMKKTAISVRDVSKKYNIYQQPIHRLKEYLALGTRSYHQEFWALKSIRFDVCRGEVVGIIGRNGCGKSTLLQIVCGILPPTSGEIITHGRISAILELGAGFNPEFTGKDNILINGQIMGLGLNEIEDRFEEIIAFADIGDFIDQPVKTYSTGMSIRLAFACAVSLRPDILIVDEALSVGDIFFQQKCFAKIREILSRGTTCLFVSHDTAAITNLCDRVVLLNKGEMDFEGAPEEAVSRYFSKIGTRFTPPDVKTKGDGSPPREPQEDQVISLSDILKHNILNTSHPQHGSGGLEVVAVRVVDRHGRDALEVKMLESLNFYVLLRANQDIYEPSTGVILYDRLGNLVFSAGARQLRQRLPDLSSGQELVVKMEITFNVQPGEYTFSLGTSEPSEQGPHVGYIHEMHDMLGPIVVTADYDQPLPFYGIAQLPMNMKVLYSLTKEEKK
ncbi:MAG: hypothetical protein A2156_12025 [Deltaproteobacteria bacterium RBG_16_48_10]|nr:MAG: hypothetical protein A2156_12025 [Deltaproteobacteria bacterium RBG_16_48_10]